MAVDGLAELRAGERAGDADGGEERGAAPAHVTGAGVRAEVEESGNADRRGARADREVRAADPDDVEKERRRQNGAAAPDETQREPGHAT